MSTPAAIRIVASLALLGSLGAAAYFFMVAGIRQTYFPDEHNGYLYAIVISCCLLAGYLVASIRLGRFLWIMRPREHEGK